jgi:2-phospho-L-lactate/phosphoenolpyruvate guanylyltransferase
VRTIAVLPVKGFGAAKQRLSGMLGSGSRRALAQAMFCDVLASLRHVAGLDAVAVVTGDRQAESTALGYRMTVLPDTGQAGQSEAASIGIRFALGGGYDRVLLVPADTPLLDPAEVDGLLSLASRRRLGLIVVPDRHGSGTNALLLSPPDTIAPSFGPGSLERHLQAADVAAVAHAVEQPASLLLDIDTPDDLAQLAARLEGRHGLAPLTRGALAQLGRSHVRGPSVAGRPQQAAARA